MRVGGNGNHWEWEGNGNNQWEWEGNGNKARLNLGLGMGMLMNDWELEEMGLKHGRPQDFLGVGNLGGLGLTFPSGVHKRIPDRGLG